LPSAAADDGYDLSISSAETEQHFPNLTVSQTLEFAASARCVSPSLFSFCSLPLLNRYGLSL
jgi:hypothetical protein